MAYHPNPGDELPTTLQRWQSGYRLLQKVDPPTQVIDAFRDVPAARADSERAQNEAQTYANRVIPEARGRAAQITQSAEAYREQTVAEAKGQAARFIKIYDEYRKAPEITRERSISKRWSACSAAPTRSSLIRPAGS
jgi:modulator of FtsH protease HflK